MLTLNPLTAPCPVTKSGDLKRFSWATSSMKTDPPVRRLKPGCERMSTGMTSEPTLSSGHPTPARRIKRSPSGRSPDLAERQVELLREEPGRLVHELVQVEALERPLAEIGGGGLLEGALAQRNLGALELGEAGPQAEPDGGLAPQGEQRVGLLGRKRARRTVGDAEEPHQRAVIGADRRGGLERGGPAVDEQVVRARVAAGDDDAPVRRGPELADRGVTRQLAQARAVGGDGPLLAGVGHREERERRAAGVRGEGGQAGEASGREGAAREARRVASRSGRRRTRDGVQPSAVGGAGSGGGRMHGEAQG